MLIATWNINGMRARLEFLTKWLEAREPDLVALQELKLTDDLFPHEELARLGYRAVTHGQKSWNGVAILSRTPLETTEVGLPGEDAFGARLISARAGELEFTSVYCPNGKHVGHDDYPRKLAWFDSLAAWLDERLDASGAHVLGGDFNVCPAALDSWNEELLAGSIFHTTDERRRMETLAELGLVDLYRALHSDRQAFSWWDYRGGAFHRRQGLRIDLLLGTKAVVERLQSAEIDRDWRKKHDGLTPSDHAPVLARID